MTGFSVPAGGSRPVRFAFGWLPLLCLAWGLVACDTVAELSIAQRDFRNAVTDGVTNAASCSADASDTSFVMRFTPFDGDQVVLVPGEQVNGQRLVLGSGADRFGEDDIRFVNTVLYPIPDVPCTGDGQCTAPFTCQRLNPAGDSSQACGLPVPVQTLQRGVVYDEGAANKFLAIVMDYSASLGGVDAQGNFDSSRATDRLDQRLAAVRPFARNFFGTTVGRNQQACVVSFGGSDLGGVVFQPTPAQCMTANQTEVDGELARLGIGEQGLSPVWTAVHATITEQLATRNGDRILVLFTDGLDDSSVTFDFEDVLATAVDNSVRIHIVHLDNPPAGVARTGPADEYARLACATGGSYQYATSPNDLRSYYSTLGHTVPSWYEVQGQVIALGDPALALPNGCYRLALGAGITINGREVTIQLAADKTDASTQQIIDDRLVVCKRPVPAPGPPDNGGEGGGGGSEQ
jgi:hypothetical protein